MVKKLCPVLFSLSLDFVLTNSIFTHGSLLCIVLRLSCPLPVLLQCWPCVRLVYLSCRYQRWEWAADFWVESSIVCGATQSHIANSSGERRDRNRIEDRELLYIFMIQVHMCDSVHHRFSCNFSSSSVLLKLYLFSFNLTRRGSADPSVY